MPVDRKPRVLSTRDRLKPFLLDRLTDHEATLRPNAAAVGRAELTLSPREYREAVLRDLRWLLNSQSPPEFEGLEQFPQLARSVLNYGLPDLTQVTVGGPAMGRLEQWLHRAIERFEPRILPGSLSIRLGKNQDSNQPGLLYVEIEAEVWAVPVPESVLLRTHIDLGTGDCEVTDR